MQRINWNTLKRLIVIWITQKVCDIRQPINQRQAAAVCRQLPPPHLRTIS